MLVGAWIHGGGISVGEQIPLATHNEINSARSYTFDYARRVATVLENHSMSLLGGMHVEARDLVRDWHSQVRLDELAAYHELGVRLDTICVGNELREGGDEPDKKRFMAALSENLVNVMRTYRLWLDEHGYATPLTYAMEGIVFDSQGRFHEWVWPLVDACDIVGVKFYPMTAEGWFTFDAFEESCLTETGFPSAVGYHMEGKRLAVPESDNQCFAATMQESPGVIRQLDREYGNPIRALYFYEWRDDLYHDKIWNVERSPIHTAFGLCDCFGMPKFKILKSIKGL